MLRVWSDVLPSADVREVTLPGLRDLSAAFDCVDHDIGLCSCRVRGVDGSCAKHLNVESYMVIYAPNSYTYYYYY